MLNTRKRAKSTDSSTPSSLLEKSIPTKPVGQPVNMSSFAEQLKAIETTQSIKDTSTTETPTSTVSISNSQLEDKDKTIVTETPLNTINNTSQQENSQPSAEDFLVDEFKISITKQGATEARSLNNLLWNTSSFGSHKEIFIRVFQKNISSFFNVLNNTKYEQQIVLLKFYLLNRKELILQDDKKIIAEQLCTEKLESGWLNQALLDACKEKNKEEASQLIQICKILNITIVLFQKSLDFKDAVDLCLENDWSDLIDEISSASEMADKITKGNWIYFSAVISTEFEKTEDGHGAIYVTALFNKAFKCNNLFLTKKLLEIEKFKEILKSNIGIFYALLQEAKDEIQFELVKFYALNTFDNINEQDEIAEKLKKFCNGRLKFSKLNTKLLLACEENNENEANTLITICSKNHPKENFPSDVLNCVIANQWFDVFSSMTTLQKCMSLIKEDNWQFFHTLYFEKNYTSFNYQSNGVFEQAINDENEFFAIKLLEIFTTNYILGKQSTSEKTKLLDLVYSKQLVNVYRAILSNYKMFEGWTPSCPNGVSNYRSYDAEYCFYLMYMLQNPDQAKWVNKVLHGQYEDDKSIYEFTKKYYGALLSLMTSTVPYLAPYEQLSILSLLGKENTPLVKEFYNLIQTKQIFNEQPRGNRGLIDYKKHLDIFKSQKVTDSYMDTIHSWPFLHQEDILSALLDVPVFWPIFYKEFCHYQQDIKKYTELQLSLKEYSTHTKNDIWKRDSEELLTKFSIIKVIENPIKFNSNNTNKHKVKFKQFINALTFVYHLEQYKNSLEKLYPLLAQLFPEGLHNNPFIESAYTYSHDDIKKYIPCIDTYDRPKQDKIKKSLNDSLISCNIEFMAKKDDGIITKAFNILNDNLKNYLVNAQHEEMIKSCDFALVQPVFSGRFVTNLFKKNVERNVISSIKTLAENMLNPTIYIFTQELIVKNDKITIDKKHLEKLVFDTKKSELYWLWPNSTFSSIPNSKLITAIKYDLENRYANMLYINDFTITYKYEPDASQNLPDPQAGSSDERTHEMSGKKF